MLFDLDGTLVDTMDLIVRSYQVAFREVLGTSDAESAFLALIDAQEASRAGAGTATQGEVA